MALESMRPIGTRGILASSRFKLYVLMLILLILTAGIGSSRNVSPQEAQRVVNEVRKQIGEPGASGIFLNNFRIALLMLIPGFGFFTALFSMYSTGSVIAAFATNQNLPGPLLLIATMFLPFFWLEFLSYALATTESVLLVGAIFKRRLKSEAKKALLAIPVIAILLFLGAVIEAYLIGTLRP